MTQIITTLSEVSDQYDAMFVDLWGCMHDGIKALPEACAAMTAYRERGGIVVLVTNSPRPWTEVVKQLDTFGVPKESWDAIASSGDSARAAMFTGAVGSNVWFIGQPHEDTFFKPMDVIDEPVEITQVPYDVAEGIVCCGPEDPQADPEVYRAHFLHAKQRGLKLLCANPDIVVDRGESREWCGGALAKLYAEMGGESLYFGKPHPPIYDLARRRLNALGHNLENPRILAVGDGILTDIAGAVGESLDCLFITGGLAREETKTETQPDPDALTAYLDKEQSNPTYTIGYLR